jgi:hypothetical protein
MVSRQEAAVDQGLQLVTRRGVGHEDCQVRIQGGLAC